MKQAAHGAAVEERTSTGLNHRKLLMWAFLGSDCMFFGALIATHLIYRTRSSAVVLPFHEARDAVQGAFGISSTVLGLGVLLPLAGVALALALRGIYRGQMKQTWLWLAALGALVVTFLALNVAAQHPAFTEADCAHLKGTVEGSGCRAVLAENLLSIPITSISTFVLLTSSLGMVLALAAIQRGDLPGLRLWLAVTVLFGITFLGFQVYEFNAFRLEGLTPRTNMFGSTFFTLTGFHGAHVTIGVLWLASLLVASFRGKVRRETSLDVEIAGLYWHFVDIVWIVIFGVIYLIGAQGVE